jgi:hypothetical protein
LRSDLIGSENTSGLHLIRGFITANELREFRYMIREKSDLFVQTSGRGTLGPRYNVIDGDQIRSEMPALLSYGERKVRPLVEQFASGPVRLMQSSKRAMRIQLYRSKRHGFRWHFDGHSYAALLTLKNTLRGQTQVVSPKMSSVLRFLPSIFYTIPRMLDFLPYRSVTMQERDLLLMHGSKVLHRGVSLDEKGERLLVVYAYDETTKSPNPIKDRIARKINY